MTDGGRSIEDLVRTIKGRALDDPEVVGAQAELQIRLARELVQAVGNLTAAIATSSREAAGLSRRLIWLNWFVVVLTAVLVVLTAVLVRIGVLGLPH